MDPVRISAEAIARLIAELWPGAEVGRIDPLGQDAAPGDATVKGFGYGVPLKIGVRGADGAAREVVLHTATANEFGHDRRADRAALQLDAFDGFGRIPGHVAALDVGAIGADGALRSLRGCGEH